MTNEKIEEQVEEYTKHNATIFYDARTDNPVYDDTEEIKQAWKDGAKWGIANAIEWHDLREDPEDLPKEFNVIKKAFGMYPEEKAIHIVLNQDGEYVHYLSGDWYYIYDEDIVEDSSKVDVIAWCELPKFKE